MEAEHQFPSSPTTAQISDLDTLDDSIFDSELSSQADSTMAEVIDLVDRDGDWTSDLSVSDEDSAASQRRRGVLEASRWIQSIHLDDGEVVVDITGDKTRSISFLDLTRDESDLDSDLDAISTISSQSATSGKGGMADSAEQSPSPPECRTWENISIRLEWIKLRLAGELRRFAWNLSSSRWESDDGDVLKGRIELPSLVEVGVRPGNGYPQCFVLKRKGLLFNGPYAEDGTISVGAATMMPMLRNPWGRCEFIGSLLY